MCDGFVGYFVGVECFDVEFDGMCDVDCVGDLYFELVGEFCGYCVFCDLVCCVGVGVVDF